MFALVFFSLPAATENTLNKSESSFVVVTALKNILKCWYKYVQFT